MKNTFLHGTVAGISAGLAAFVYNYAYSVALLVDFSKVINPVAIFGSSIFGCVLASGGYHFFSKWVRSNTDVWFNTIFLGLTFASFVSPFAANLPTDIETPELFAGLTVPMHIFPVLFWLATKPLFNKTQYN
jgi:predicted membrane channel-forming protein YqfA (hemolysin III family)